MTEKKPTPVPKVLWASISSAVIAILGYTLILPHIPNYEFSNPLARGKGGVENIALASAPQPLAPREANPDLIEEEYQVGQNSTVYLTLAGAKIDNNEIQKILAAAEPLVALNKIQSGTKILVSRDVNTSNVTSLIFKLSPLKSLLLHHDEFGEDWTASIDTKRVETREFAFAGTIEDNLWNSAINAGLEPQTIYTFAEIFSWEIDFDREIRPSDTWRLLVEREFIDGQPYRWGNIVVAEYRKGGDYFVAIRYPNKDGSASYYDTDGVSVMGSFLKSPIPYGRITSRFQNQRFHPILKIKRPHLGVDYGAPRGTPVRAVGDGRVMLAGRKGSNGIMVKIRHNTTYQTAYKHLSKLGKGVKNNSLVKQGQVIGFVGATGLATGPHLHFEFYENGAYVDPLGRRFPREQSIARNELPAFRELAENAIHRLNSKYMGTMQGDDTSEATEVAQEGQDENLVN